MVVNMTYARDDEPEAGWQIFEYIKLEIAILFLIKLTFELACKG